MSGFTSEVLRNKLNDLNNSQQSIQTLSLWLVHYRKHSKTIVQTWMEELKKVKPSRRITFMYLANDVIQNSRKKGSEFTKEFVGALKFAFEFVSKDADKKMYTQLDRILSIWSERNIYEQNVLIEFRKSLKSNHHLQKETDSPTKDKPAIKKRPLKDDGSPAKKPKVSLLSQMDVELPIKGENVDSKDLINCLKSLENTASSDAFVREKIAKLPPEISDASYVEKLTDKNEAAALGKKVDDACEILDNYNRRLEQELEERKKISYKIAAYFRYQKELQDKAQDTLNEFIERLNKIKHVKSALKLHLKNLPDLDKLPSIIETPLPKPGELFVSGKKEDLNELNELKNGDKKNKKDDGVKEEIKNNEEDKKVEEVKKEEVKNAEVKKEDNTTESSKDHFKEQESGLTKIASAV